MRDESAQTREEHSQVPWSRRQPKQAAVVYVAAYLVVAVLGGVIVAALEAVLAPYLEEPVSTAAVLALGLVVMVIAAVVLALSLLLVLSVCRIPMGARGELPMVLAMLALFCLVRPQVFAFLGRWLGNPAAGKQIADALSVVPGQLLLGNTVLIVWAGFLGRLVSRVIREGKLLLPVAIVASLADVITVFWGVVAHITETAPEVAETFSAAAPVVAPPEVAVPILSAVGIGDFLFLALFLAVALRYSMRPARTMWATFAAMLVAPVAFYVMPNAPGMPGLPFISAAALWANWSYMKFTQEEKRALVFSAALVAAVAAGLWIAFHR